MDSQQCSEPWPQTAPAKATSSRQDYHRVAIWPCVRPFLRAFGFKILVWHFGTFLAFLGEFGHADFCLALMLFFGFILASSTRRYRSTTIEVTEYAPTPIFRYHTPTVWPMATYSTARASAQWRDVTSLICLQLVCIARDFAAIKWYKPSGHYVPLTAWPYFLGPAGLWRTPRPVRVDAVDAVQFWRYRLGDSVLAWVFIVLSIVNHVFA